MSKFYYSYVKAGFEVVQFNLIHPHLTDAYNPLINALQEFRQGNDTKGEALIDAVSNIIFPDVNGEIWNPAAGNMFKRAVYAIFSYYTEREAYMREQAVINGTPAEVLESEIDKMYSKISMYNVNALIGELCSKVSKDPNFINIKPDAAKVTEKDFLSLLCDAHEMLPVTPLRSKLLKAHQSIKNIAPAPQTLASVYATLLTGLSSYIDGTVTALMTGSPREAFDVRSLGFPRRFGVQFHPDFVKTFRIANEMTRWQMYRDADFKEPYEGSDYIHEERISTTNWVN